MKYLVSLLLCLCTTLAAQRELSGVVVDAASGEPLSFVNVFLKNDQSIGVLTNEYGEYRINLSEEQMADELVFSLLSYETHYFALQDLPPTQSVYNLQMSTSFVALEEVVVLSDLGLRQIVQRAIDAIPENYGTEDYLLRGYFRKYDIDDGAYSQVTEAMVSIRDQPYSTANSKEKPRAWVDHFRRSDYTGNAREMFQTNKSKQTILLGDYAGLANSARMNAVHWLSIIFTEEGMGNMTYVQRGEYLDGKDTLIRIQYGIDFDESELNASAAKAISSFISGELLINKSDYAILRNTQGDAGKQFYKDAIYQKIGDKYFVKQLKSIRKFNYNELTQTHFSNTLFYATEVISDKKAVRKAKKGKRIDPEAKVEEVTVAYDPNFWDRNEILLSIPAPEAMDRELSQLRSLREQFLENARRVKRDTMKK